MTHIHYKWYRYDYFYGGDRLEIRLREFVVVRETPKGLWLWEIWQKHSPPWHTGQMLSEDKFVLKYARKRYAHPTTELAKKSFLARKDWEIWHCKKQLKRAVLAKNLMEKGLTEGYQDNMKVEVTERKPLTLDVGKYEF